jgi:quercetin dioxygenase-like cupin family protein
MAALGCPWPQQDSAKSLPQGSSYVGSSIIGDDDRREAVKKNSLLSALVVSAVLWPAAAYTQTAGGGMGTVVKTDEMKWQPLEGGFEISILYTNPTTQATYLVIRGPGNLHVPRHWHSSNESITVLKGTFVVGHDGSSDKTELKAGGVCLHAREDDSRGVDG